jgi:hypothetical protein
VRRGIIAGLALVSTLIVACNPQAPTSNESTPAVGASVHPTVSWPAETAADEGALLALDGVRDARARIARSPVPVLAPTSVSLVTPVLVVEAEYYALSGRDGDAAIAIQGTRMARRYENIPPVAGDRAVRGVRGFVSVNEGIRTASWIENGAAYSVDVECKSVEDHRCASEEYLLDLVSRLAFVGGAGR